MYSTVRHPWHWQYSQYSKFASLCHYLEAQCVQYMHVILCMLWTHTQPYMHPYMQHIHMQTLIHNPINPHFHTAHMQEYKPYALTVSDTQRDTLHA